MTACAGATVLDVPPLARAEIDHWPIDDAGLTVRVINSTRAAGIRTVGELRRWSESDLLKLRSLGRVSIERIRFFFRLCEQIEAGHQRFQSLREVFDIFLDGSESMVLGARYGLSSPVLRASRNFVTLQEIGNAQQRTRERVRQVEESAKKSLHSRLATVCLRPFREFFARFMHDRGQVAATEDFAVLVGDPAMAGMNPCGALLLLHDLLPGPITYFAHFFSTLSRESLTALREAAAGALQHCQRPVPLAEIAHDLRATTEQFKLVQPSRVLTVLLDHAPGIAALADHRYFLFQQGTSAFLGEILRESSERPLHFRAVTARFNQLAKPGSRKGAGYILEHLNASPACLRVDRGLYDLAAP